MSVAGIDGDHIEATGAFGPARLLLQKKFGGENPALPLARVDALPGSAPGAMPAGADFDEYYCIAVEHDQIELSAATGPILAKCGKALSP